MNTKNAEILIEFCNVTKCSDCPFCKDFHDICSLPDVPYNHELCPDLLATYIEEDEFMDKKEFNRKLAIIKLKQL